MGRNGQRSRGGVEIGEKVLAGKKEKRIKARVTHLEMTRRPTKSFPVPTRPRSALLSAENMPVHFYRYLYEQVGKAHHWYLRRVMDDAGIAEIIHSADTSIDVLYADGSPAGFFELDMRALPESVEITYFGLMPEFQGLGLGKWFLNGAIQKAFDRSPEKVIIHTNTLDHPAALSLYQKMGFEPVGVSEEEVTTWE